MLKTLKTLGSGIILQESTLNTHSLKIDRENHVIKGCKLIGTYSPNRGGREYTKGARVTLARLMEGKRVNVDHSEQVGKTRSIRDRIGLLRNIDIREEGNYGDFHYNPKHELIEQILYDAEHNPTNFGFSIDAKGTVVRKGNKNLVESVELLRSVDLVADPATVAGLFESEEPEDLEEGNEDMTLKEITMEQLRRERPDLIESFQAELKESVEAQETVKKLKDLQEQLDRVNNEKAELAKVTAISAELKEAKLDENDKEVVSEAFMSTLKMAKDKDARKVLIDDRAKLVEGRKVERKAPTSSSRFGRPTGSDNENPGATAKERIGRWGR